MSYSDAVKKYKELKVRAEDNIVEEGEDNDQTVREVLAEDRTKGRNFESQTGTVFHSLTSNKPTFHTITKNSNATESKKAISDYHPSAIHLNSSTPLRSSQSSPSKSCLQSTSFLTTLTDARNFPKITKTKSVDTECLELLMDKFFHFIIKLFIDFVPVSTVIKKFQGFASQLNEENIAECSARNFL